MQEDFHYYATYAAAFLAGYTHAEALDICYSAQFTDHCTRTFLTKVRGPKAAATTQTQMELMEANTDIVGLQDITRIWASFHFLPRDLYAVKKHCSKRYRSKYRLICGPNGELVKDTVMLARNMSLQSVGLAMHILADTWAHQYFAGTPSLVINNTNSYFYEIFEDGHEEKVVFRHSATSPDDIEAGKYTASIYVDMENTIMNLGHGRAGHFPDYSFIKYKYLPAWGGYEEVVKDNPSDYYKAFAQMVYAMKYFRGDYESFELDTYAYDVIEPYRERIEAILRKRQADSCADWNEFIKELSGQAIEPFDICKYQEEYMAADKENRQSTFLGAFFLSAMAQKSMVTNKIYKSGNRLAGFSVDYKRAGFRGIRDFRGLVKYLSGGDR